MINQVDDVEQKYDGCNKERKKDWKKENINKNLQLAKT